jgi:hypothetical protein
MFGLIKNPVRYINTQVSLDPLQLGAWMRAHGLTHVSVYTRGFVCNYILDGDKAKEL